MQNRSTWLNWAGGLSAVALGLQLELFNPLFPFIALALVFFTWGKPGWPERGLWFLAFWGFWQLASLGWSDALDRGWTDVGLVAPLVLLPIIASAWGRGRVKPRQWLVPFAWATVAQWTVSFGWSVAEHGLVHYKEVALFGRFGLHYQSLYLVVAAMVLEREAWRHTKGKAAAHIVAVLWLLTGVIFLSARIHLIVVPALVLARLVELAVGRKELRSRIVRWGTLALLALGVLVAVLPGPRRRLIDLRNEMRSIEGLVDGKQTNHRIFLWSYGAEIIAENWLWGTGNGDEDLELHEKLKTCDAAFYRGKERYYLYDDIYDYHNILLQAWAEGGVLGISSLVGFLLWGFWRSRGAVRMAWAAFVLTGMTESLLDRQAGTYLLTFLAVLIVLSRKPR